MAHCTFLSVVIFWKHIVGSRLMQTKEFEAERKNHDCFISGITIHLISTAEIVAQMATNTLPGEAGQIYHSMLYINLSKTKCQLATVFSG